MNRPHSPDRTAKSVVSPTPRLRASHIAATGTAIAALIAVASKSNADGPPPSSSPPIIDRGPRDGGVGPADGGSAPDGSSAADAGTICDKKDTGAAPPDVCIDGKTVTVTVKLPLPGTGEPYKRPCCETKKTPKAAPKKVKKRAAAKKRKPAPKPAEPAVFDIPERGARLEFPCNAMGHPTGLKLRLMGDFRRYPFDPEDFTYELKQNTPGNPNELTVTMKSTDGLYIYESANPIGRNRHNESQACKMIRIEPPVPGRFGGERLTEPQTVDLLAEKVRDSVRVLFDPEGKKLKLPDGKAPKCNTYPDPRDADVVTFFCWDTRRQANLFGAQLSVKDLSKEEKLKYKVPMRPYLR
ncbi:hypothetical protein COV82_02190 [Candidatus Peregrinibacteria bacterium CG11_big_fil_rev_8_21_14_0_20_46_8]|nr:MAG: hypothetical protein COV82_02190 [Candidatus Peregrinibacteria bacterium CG11_big_fil_rev_8_21_14_0_20_46_8]